MKITVTYKDEIIASGELGKEVVNIEGSYYFDQKVVEMTRLKMKGSGGQYFCPIKQGSCDYYDFVDQDGKVVIDEVGWIYENPKYLLPCKGKIAFYKDKGFTIN
jgi:uncharacterized protein (DUF427 family)